MQVAPLEAIDQTLLLISEARESAERAIDVAEPDSHLVDALKAADAELHAIHKRLMDRAYFPSPESAESQLRLDAA
jgi:hypothetical protein